MPSLVGRKRKPPESAADLIRNIQEKLQNKQNEIKSLQAEVDLLKNALQVNMQIISSLPSQNGTISSVTGDLTGKTIVQAAMQILAGDRQLHYAKIAEIAMSRGYRGREGSTKDTIAGSFGVTMNRDKENFEGDGEGRFKLKTPEKSA